MPDCSIKILTPQGLVPAPYAACSLEEAVQYEPDDGVYTVTNTYNTHQVLKFDAHLDRMEDSARREGFPLKLDRRRLRAALREMIDEAGYGSVRFRMTVSRTHPDHIVFTLEPFLPQPPEVYANGVRCITVPDSARHNPRAKYARWMHNRRAIAGSLEKGIYTALLLNHAGDILEGLSSNFYAIVGGELYTSDEGALPGIAQQIVFAVAPGILPIRRQAVNVRDLPRLDETFITSSSRGIVPVVEIDGQQIGQGRPGPLTQSLREAYLAWVEEHLEEL